jgi:multicomponent Na+:H+ antiporter subunit E
VKTIAWVIFLAVIWETLAGDFTLGTIVLGLVLGFLVVKVAHVDVAPRQRAKLIPAAMLMPYFAWELILSNLRVAVDVVRPRMRMRPGIVAIPLDAASDAEITWLANLVTLTPGTLSLDVSHDRKVLYIHAMDVADAEQLRREIKAGFEKRVMEVWR